VLNSCREKLNPPRWICNLATAKDKHEAIGFAPFGYEIDKPKFNEVNTWLKYFRTWAFNFRNGEALIEVGTI
jgi:hypothetical protein